MICRILSRTPAVLRRSGAACFSGAAGTGPLHGRVALVTGSTSGIGESIARSLGRAGANLILNGLIRGNVRAKKAIELHAPARLYGDLETPQLVIHSGVIFEGHCKMENLSVRQPEILKSVPPPVPKDKP